MTARGVVLAAALALGAPQASLAQDAAFVGELERLLGQGRIEDLRAAMAAGGRPAELVAMSDWARAALLAGRAGGAVALGHAATHGRLGEWEEQRRWFAYGMFLLQVDAARCAADDLVRGRRQALAAAVDEGMADFRSYPVEARRLAAEQGAGIEAETRPRRQPDGWLCGGRFVADEDWRRALPAALAEARAALLK
jgi:hypothetical protein